MTMDIQKVNRSESLSPELKMSLSHSADEMKAHEQYQTKVDSQFTGCNPSRANKRSFDVAFLMMPDEKMKQKQLEKHLRVSKQLFHESQYAAAKTEAENLRRNTEYLNKSQIYVNNRDLEESKVTDLTTSSCYSEKYRHNNNISPQSNQDTNIDVGTDEFATKSVLSDSDVSDMSRSRPNSTESFSRPVRIVNDSMCRNTTIYDDPTMHLPRPAIENSEKYLAARLSDLNQRSAFTKVSNSFHSNPIPQPPSSPGHSESPDNLSYQNSMSPPLTASSPSVINNIFNKNSPFKSLIPSNHPLSSAFFKTQGPYQNYSDQHLNSHGSSESSQFSKSSSPAYGSSEKVIDADKSPTYQSTAAKFGNFLPFRPDLPRYLQGNSGYPFHMQSFQGNNDFIKFPQQTEIMTPLIRNPAAALLSTLLPPTLATLSLPSQNICAKCNISFRMTSDLVYHMRSHHKSESNYDVNRRKREEKLKCPVCAESFRERHHLTRHMTAHQDKEGDILDHQMDAQATNGAYKGKNRSFYLHANGMQTK